MFAGVLLCGVIMPELPEVETTRRGIEPHLIGKQIKALEVRTPRLRWPVPPDLGLKLEGQPLVSVVRRAKYLLFPLDSGALMVHLGMSGSLRLIDSRVPPEKHEHVDLHLDSGMALRYTDPRRFGFWLWAEAPWETHPLLATLGPEPLSEHFTAEYLFAKSRKRRVAIKPFLMTNQVVVGVGNIYATEALFASGIDPRRSADTLTESECQRLVLNVQRILSQAIESGGTTLKDFVGGDGRPGYFQQQLLVYGRKGQPCVQCGNLLQEVQLGQRTSTFCSQCQR